MANDLTPIDDDGFHGPLISGRLIKGIFIKWTDAAHWTDRDGLAPPSPMLVIAINEVLQRWKNNKVEIIASKPLPNIEELNSAIPMGEWEKGVDNKPRPPWAHTVVVYFVDLGTGAFFTYVATTTGAHMAYDALRESVLTMRALRGTRSMPLVRLEERPFKTNFGLRTRPHFQIIDWKEPGGDNNALPPKPSTPQLGSPTKTASAPMSAPAVNNPTQTYQAKPKPPVKLANETLHVMGDVKPLTASEILNDELPW
jgi:hypothetical protein